METPDKTVDISVESVTESPELDKVTAPKAVTPTVADPIKPAPAPIAVPTTEVATPAMSKDFSTDLLAQANNLWQQYFGGDKKSNLTIAIAILLAIPIIIAADTVLDFLHKLPLLPSVFELVGFGYTLWFIYRYLLLAHTRKELIEGITAWKQKVLG